jgi:hypothetical protein
VDSALTVIEAVIVTLNADVTVNALLAGRIYTDVPQKADFPYLVLSIDSEPFAASDFSGQTHSLRLQVFSQSDGAKESLTIRKTCTDALDRQEGSITLSAGTLVKCEYSGSGTMFQEDDGKTWQAINQLQVIVV